VVIKKEEFDDSAMIKMEDVEVKIEGVD